MTRRNVPETLAPMRLPASCIIGSPRFSHSAANTTATASASTTLECPSEKKKPMPSGRCPFWSM